MAELTNEVKTALELRRACARFRRDLARLVPAATRVGLACVLNEAVGGLARLSERAARAGLPDGAAEGLRGLHADILDWLRLNDSEPAEPAAPEGGEETEDGDWTGGGMHGAGLRLWTELYGFSALLYALSHTEEVMSHDRDLIEQVQAELDRIPASTYAVPPVIRVLLDGLFGRDDELDTLLGRRDEVSRFELEPILDRIALDELDEAAGGGGAYGYDGETIH